MTFSSPSLIQHLQELAQQITAAPPRVEALYAAFRGQNVAHAFATHMEADRHVYAMATAVAHIKAQVVPHDGLGAVVESISELVLRAQRRIVLAELDTLRDIAGEPSTCSRCTALAFNPFERVEDWIGYVGHEVNGSAQGWIDYRGQAGERAAYRVALREAHAAMRRLAERSKATPFLLDAVVRTDWPALQVPCSRISVALTIPIDVDPDMPVVVIDPRSSELVAGATVMIDDVLRASSTDRETSSLADAVPSNVCRTAIAEVVRLILELKSTNAAIDYENGARVRRELERGLREAQQTFEALPDGPTRAEALRRIDGLRTVADRRLVIAPTPSAAAIAAAEAGDRNVLLGGPDELAAERLGHGSSRPRPARRPHSDTRPESPGALGIGPCTTNPETAGLVAPAPPENPALDEEHQ